MSEKKFSKKIFFVEKKKKHLLEKNVGEKILLEKKKLLEKYFCQGKNFVGKSVFIREKTLLEKENCWKKIFVRKKLIFFQKKFLSKKFFLKKKL